MMDKSAIDKKKLLNGHILDGKVLRDLGVQRLKLAFSKFVGKPTLAVIQVGDLAESSAYIEQKRKFAEKIGAGFIHEKFSADVSEEDLSSAINRLNSNSKINGIIVQLPIPVALNKRKIIDTILPKKDVDGLTTTNKKLFETENSSAIVPATARGVLSLLEGYGIDVNKKKVTVVGRSELVGGPIATLFAHKGSLVTVCHRGTPDMTTKCRNADILIVATGVPRLVDRNYVTENQVVVDVGISSVLGDKLEEEIPRKVLVGDVDFNDVKDIVSAISPVPGGVGPMTVLSLFENLFDASKNVI